MTPLKLDRSALRTSRCHSIAFWLIAVIHCAVTIVVTLWSVGWQMVILDTGGTAAPFGLRIVMSIDLLLTLPALLPLARLMLYLGFADPVNDPIYWPLPILNSLLVAYGVTALIRWYAARRRAFQQRSPL